MLKQEFENKVGMEVSNDEYTAIEKVYMNSDVDKDEFCKSWQKMNAKRINAYKKSKNDEEKKVMDKWYAFKILSKLEKDLGFESYSELADIHLSRREKNFLHGIGIDMRRCSCNGIMLFKYCNEVETELRYFINR